MQIQLESAGQEVGTTPGLLSLQQASTCGCSAPLHRARPVLGERPSMGSVGFGGVLCHRCSGPHRMAAVRRRRVVLPTYVGSVLCCAAVANRCVPTARQSRCASCAAHGSGAVLCHRCARRPPPSKAGAVPLHSTAASPSVRWCVAAAQRHAPPSTAAVRRRRAVLPVNWGLVLCHRCASVPSHSTSGVRRSRVVPSSGQVW